MKKNCCEVWVITENQTFMLEAKLNLKLNSKLNYQIMLLKKIRSYYTCWYTWFSCYKSFHCFKSWSWQTRHIKLVNVLTSLNNLKIKVDDLDVGKLKTVPVDFKN